MGMEEMLRQVAEDAKARVAKLVEQETRDEAVRIAKGYEERPVRPEPPEATPAQVAQVKKLLADYNAARTRATEKFASALEETRTMHKAFMEARGVTSGTRYGIPHGFGVSGPKHLLDRMAGMTGRFWNVLLGMATDTDVAKELDRND